MWDAIDFIRARIPTIMMLIVFAFIFVELKRESSRKR
jgi:hypothetical protein